jgi:hypothetical protein
MIESKTYHFSFTTTSPHFTSNGPRLTHRKVSGETLAISHRHAVTRLETKLTGTPQISPKTYHFVLQIRFGGPTSWCIPTHSNAPADKTKPSPCEQVGGWAIKKTSSTAGLQTLDGS